MTDTDDAAPMRRFPIWALVLVFYVVLAALHSLLALRLQTEEFQFFQTSLRLSYVFVTFVCLVGALGAWAVQRKGVLLPFLVQVGLSATLLMMSWLPTPASWIEQIDLPEASFFLAAFYLVGIGPSEETAPLFHVLSVILCYLILVPLVLIQWWQAGASSITQMQFPKLLTELFGHSNKPEVELPRMSADAKFVVEFLQQSIAETKARAGWILRLIMLLLVAGVLVIVFAGRITSLDLVASDAASSIERELATLNNRRDRLEKSNQDLFERQNLRMTALEAAQINLEISTQTGEIDISNSEIGKFLVSFQENLEFRDYIISSFGTMPDFLELVRASEVALERDGVDISEDLQLEIVRKSALSYFQSIVREVRKDNNLALRNAGQVLKDNERRAKIQELIDEETQKRIEAIASPGEQSSSFLVASAITRFGIVAIIIYIIQVLVALYRYNMRLASFYGSRLKAVIQGQNKDSSIDFFAKLFDTAQINFGKDISGPTQDIKEVIQSAIEQAGKAWAKSPSGT